MDATMVTSLLDTLDAVVWNANYWLPRGMEWEDLHPRDGGVYPEFRDILVVPVILSILLILFRSYILNPLILEPIAKYWQLPYRRHKPLPQIPQLETRYLESKGVMPRKVLEKTSVSLQMSKRQVESWLRKRSNVGKLSKLDKFQDSSFILLYHTLITAYGCYVMLSKPWLWDITICYQNFPYHQVDTQLWWYYMIGCAFYWEQTIWQFRYSHGKDANLAYLHHICTIFLLVCSWKCNYVRVGSIILFVHECGDIPLQLGRILRYFKEERVIDYVFASFVILWVCTRLVLYPFWILRSLFVDMPRYADLPSMTVFYVLLLLLFGMNVVWSWWIGYGVYKRLVKGVVENVVSSDDGGSSTDTHDTSRKLE
ncbi:ceramide synthase 6 [Hyalella azteca]|uniref:Ceramide synthase 6 n=1 Tax=Hyalella azteca TaxID=294128 RepID=A0A8B7PAN4_HYAAZ|nr:ceramide synthase 6 [Hyalella azteca]